MTEEAVFELLPGDMIQIVVLLIMMLATVLIAAYGRRTGLPILGLVSAVTGLMLTLYSLVLMPELAIGFGFLNIVAWLIFIASMRD